MAKITFEPGEVVSDPRGGVGVVLADRKTMVLLKHQELVRSSNHPAELLNVGPSTRPFLDTEIKTINWEWQVALNAVLISHKLPSPFFGGTNGNSDQTRVKDHDARKLMLEKFRDDYPKWTDVVTMAIFNGTSDAILPARETHLTDGGAEDGDLVVLDPDGKSQCFFRYQDGKIKCVNAPGSYHPMTNVQFLEVIRDANKRISELNDPEKWIQGFLK